MPRPAHYVAVPQARRGGRVKVLFVTVEMSPLAKVGGLADVIGSRLRADPANHANQLPRVFTIHNLAIHGGFDDIFARKAGIGPEALQSPLAWEPWVSHTGMGQGLLWSDLINTVSPTYAKEIL